LPEHAARGDGGPDGFVIQRQDPLRRFVQESAVKNFRLRNQFHERFSRALSEVKVLLQMMQYADLLELIETSTGDAIQEELRQQDELIFHMVYTQLQGESVEIAASQLRNYYPSIIKLVPGSDPTSESDKESPMLFKASPRALSGNASAES